jgi:cell wall-associated NlpC family hydrolase
MRRQLLLIIACVILAACSGSRPKQPARGSGKDLLRTAASASGVRYKFGGRDPKSGFDCSGLAWWTHRRNGINIPRTSYLQYKKGGAKKIRKRKLRRGDLVFFSTYKRGASHVGIYAGDGMFWHAPSTGKKVARANMNNKYWKKRYVGARRYW